MMGIDLGENASPLGGVTKNDLGDGDIGSNHLQNFPMITSAVPSLAEGGTTITGKLNSEPSTTYTLDFYSNPACVGRPQDFLEGRTWLGSTQVTTDGSGKPPSSDRAFLDRTGREGDRDGDQSRWRHLGVLPAPRALLDPASGNPPGSPRSR